MLQRSFLIIGVLALLTATTAFAQTKIVADVPFDFSVGDTLMPAGQYKITYNLTTKDVIRLNCRHKRATVATMAPRLEKADAGQQPKLVFNRYGKRHFLANVWMGTSVRTVPQSKAERELIAQLSRPTAVTVLAER